MLNALEVEWDRIQARTWSFRAHTQDFEFLLPTEMMVARPSLPNLRQYLRYDARAHKLVSSHDASLNQLRESCKVAYARVAMDESFKKLMLLAGGADPKYFAEYVVNGVRDLPPNYSNAGDWNRLAQEFLRLRETDSLRQAFDSLNRAGNDMRDSVKLLYGYLNDTADALADKHGLPAAPESTYDGELG